MSKYCQNCQNTFMRLRVTRQKSGKVKIDKPFKIAKDTKIIHITLRFPTKDKGGHTRTRYVRYRWTKSQNLK